MKTIQINGVQFRITRETSETTVKQIHSLSAFNDGTFTVRHVIDAIAPGVELSLSGKPDAIHSLFATPDPLSLIQRALSALGYVVGDRHKDIEQFSQWIELPKRSVETSLTSHCRNTSPI